MATAQVLWPSTLPQAPLNEGYGETASTPKVTFGTDSGPPIQRPKTTLRMTTIQCSYAMTDAQLARLEDFVFYDIAKGTSSFYGPHPRKQKQVKFTIVGEEPYSLQIMGPDLINGATAKMWRVTFQFLVVE